jgi:hypothetical protein
VGLTRLSAENQVRALTKHVNDTTRLTATDLRIYLDRAYKDVRTWLIEPAPSLYLQTSSTQAVTAGGTVSLATVSTTHEHTERVDQQLSDGNWRALERADPLMPNSHVAGKFTFREEGGLLLFGPDSLFEGNVRVLYHNTPATLTTDSDATTGTFAVPVAVEQAIIYLACGLVALADQDGSEAKAGWDAEAGKVLGAALPQLKKRHGRHPQRAGLQRVLGY